MLCVFAYCAVRTRGCWLCVHYGLVRFVVLQIYEPTYYERAAADDARRVLVSELKLNLKFV